jgi:maltooligosyltrehalose synthase
MLGWVKNCWKKTDEKYEQELHDYIMSIPHAERTITQMIEADKKQEELLKETQKKVEEVKE